MSLLLHLLRVVSLPHWKEHWVRTVLTVVGVALGVATIVAVADINRSVSAAFEHMVATVAGASALEVTSDSGAVDEALVATVAGTPGVRAAAGLVETFVGQADRADESLYLLGMDVLGSPIWEAQLPRSAIDLPDELLFLSQRDSVLLGRAFADAHRARGGERAAHRRRRAAWRRCASAGSSATSRRRACSTARSRSWTCRRRSGCSGARVRWIASPSSSSPAPPSSRSAAASPRRSGPHVEVAAPEARGAQLDKLLVSLRSMLIAAASFALIVGGAHRVPDRHGVGGAAPPAVRAARRRRHRALGAHAPLPGRDRDAGDPRRRRRHPRRLGAGVARRPGIVGAATSEIWFRVHVAHAARSTQRPADRGRRSAFGIALAAAYVAARITFSAPTVEALRPSAVEAERRAPLASAALGLAAPRRHLVDAADAADAARGWWSAP